MDHQDRQRPNGSKPGLQAIRLPSSHPRASASADDDSASPTSTPTPASTTRIVAKGFKPMPTSWSGYWCLADVVGRGMMGGNSADSVERNVSSSTTGTDPRSFTPAPTPVPPAPTPSPRREKWMKRKIWRAAKGAAAAAQNDNAPRDAPASKNKNRRFGLWGREKKVERSHKQARVKAHVKVLNQKKSEGSNVDEEYVLGLEESISL